jgi:hypothetical protein
LTRPPTRCQCIEFKIKSQVGQLKRPRYGGLFPLPALPHLICKARFPLRSATYPHAPLCRPPCLRSQERSRVPAAPTQPSCRKNWNLKGTGKVQSARYGFSTCPSPGPRFGIVEPHTPFFFLRASRCPVRDEAAWVPGRTQLGNLPSEPCWGGGIRKRSKPLGSPGT